ncbi:MAG: ribonuclease III domain-containing protein [Selenomonadaceae bacterium]|nr:ribonuclease III domain-containing protein [Selenomonadaceae bacterium]
MKFEHFQRLVRMMFEPDATGGIQQHYDSVNVRQLHPLVLAYVGDAYFHLFVRTRLLSYEQAKVQALHTFSAQIVSAKWQHQAYLGIESMLTDDEKAVYRRARNAKSHAPRSATVAEYHSSTGFEALLGSLYLRDEDERLYEIAEASFQVIANAMMQEIQAKSQASLQS